MKQHEKNNMESHLKGMGVVCRTLETAGVVTNGNFRAAEQQHQFRRARSKKQSSESQLARPRKRYHQRLLYWREETATSRGRKTRFLFRFTFSSIFEHRT